MDAQVLGTLLSPFVLALLGLCIGSFLNVVIYRLPLMMERGWRVESAELLGVKIDAPAPISLSKPRSRCPSCGHQIRWHENIPVISYVRLGGKCSACKTPISARYPAIEVLTALLFAACGWRFGAQPATLLWCGLVATLVALAFIDLDTSFLPDDLTLPLMWAGIVSAALGWIPITLGASVGGAVAGYLSLWFVFHAYRLIRGKEGMGAGDFKLLAALGAWMGWQLIPSIILLSSAVGALVGIALIVWRNHDREVPIPFGPYLAGGGVAALFFGEQLTRLWMPPGLTPQQLRIGLTGGIGSGKSTVAALLARRGAALIDTDLISRQLTGPGGAAIESIAQAFGSGILDASGALDRARMRDLVFSDPSARQRLEAILHPLIGIETQRQSAANTADVTVFDVPLLVESGRWRARVDKVLVIDCREATQVERVVARSGWTPQAVQGVIDSQAPRRLRRACADAVIYNDEITTDQLDDRVRSLWQHWAESPH